MSSITRHHAEWLSLLEISGPFLSMPVLLQVYPNGIEARDPDHAHDLRAAYEEWADNQSGLNPDPDIHKAWVRYVLEDTLGYQEDVLLEGQDIPANLKARFPEHGVTLIPDLVLVEPRMEGSDKTRQELKPRVLIQIFSPNQRLDKGLTESRWKASINTRMMELLHATEVELGIITNGEQWTTVYAPRGETTGFTSWYAHLWFDEPITLRAFRSLLGVYRFFGVPDDEVLEALLSKSAQDQHEVTDQLGYQVRRAVEILVSDLDKADIDKGRILLSEVGEDRLYEAALTVMMRLVFLLSAEERKLLPLDDPFYNENYAVSTLAAQLRETADQYGEDLLERRTDAWNRLMATFRAVYGGVRHDRLTLIAYGGSLFDPDRFPFLEGRPANTSWKDIPADPLPVDNRTVLHLLEALQYLQVKVPGGGRGSQGSRAETRRLSFRALDIEQIGHVYEGLLDHMAVRAEEPVLGLQGTKDKEPEIPLPELEAELAKGQDSLLDYLKKETGRSKNALKKALKYELDAFRAQRLRAACGNDESLLKRILSFSGLVRDDESGFPVVIPAGGVYVTAGPTRRATGTHYTPRSLTEPIVQHTLEPLVYKGPAKGWEKGKWELKSAKDILELKVCDMAMGSGAFLVQSCRYLSERLMEAWEIAEENLREKNLPINITGEIQEGTTNELILSKNEEERQAMARRLLVNRCIYGVDKNPLAVEMAKLSLWLITLDKNRPFTFLDHALKCGDSLVGANEADFLGWSSAHKDSAMPLFQEALENSLKNARQVREKLQSFQVLDVRDAQCKAQLLKEANESMKQLKLGCDLITGAKLQGLNQKELTNLSGRLLLNYVTGESLDNPEAQRVLGTAKKERAFHWEFEFPEVFEQGGFNAFIGNPPFQGGQRIRRELGEEYLLYLKTKWDHSKGSADLCAYFFLEAYENLTNKSSLGMLATNTIAQGDTREFGLSRINQLGGEIYFAINNLSWPGRAAVVVDVVNIYKGDYSGERILDERIVENISTWLDAMPSVTQAPYKLIENRGMSYQGSNILGLGFTMSEEEAKALISKDSRNANVLFPYIIGHDINSNYEQSPSRWVINFFDWPLKRESDESWFSASNEQKRAWLRKGIVPKDYPCPVAWDYPDCLERVREKVYPERQKNRNKQRREIWWRFTRPTLDLYEAISDFDKTLVIALTSKTLAFAFLPTNIVFSHATVVIASDNEALFALLQSTIHLEWTRRFGSTMKGDQRYTPTDCFETFPFPPRIDGLKMIGTKYYNFRNNLLHKRKIGFTHIYNQFHDPDETAFDISKLRELQVELDYIVATAYHWEDLELNYRFYSTQQGFRYTISEDARQEVLQRLLELNHQRYDEEVAAGLHENKNKGKGRKGKGERGSEKEEPGQYELF